MNMKKKWKYLFVVLSVSVFLLQTAAAPHAPSGSLTLSEIHPAESIFVFQVATYQETGYVPSRGFENFSLSTLPSSFEALQSLTLALKEAAATLHTPPFLQGTADSSGIVSFSELPVGLYLILGEEYKENGCSYTPAPALINLPPESAVSAIVKYDSEPIQKAYANYEVKKIWEDTGYSHHRPSSVTVRLLKNGILYDTVLLTEENRWSHVWLELDSSSQWQVEENPTPPGYTSSISCFDHCFLIINHWTDSPNTGDVSPLPYALLCGVFLLFFLFLLGQKKKQRM